MLWDLFLIKKLLKSVICKIRKQCMGALFIVDKSSVNSALVHCSRVPQITLFSNFFIKNGFYSTIYIFKNYFVSVFSVSAKISCIQTDPKSVICKNIVNGAFGVWISCWAFRFKTSVCKKVIRSCCQIEFWILKTIF